MSKSSIDSRNAELLEALESLKYAITAAGGATAGLYIQTAGSQALGTPKGTFYRIARRAGELVEYPLGDELHRAAQLLVQLRTARLALALVPDCDVPL